MIKITALAHKIAIKASVIEGNMLGGMADRDRPNSALGSATSELMKISDITDPTKKAIVVSVSGVL